MSSQVENRNENLSFKVIKNNQIEEHLIKRYADLRFFVLNMRPAAVISQTFQYCDLKGLLAALCLCTDGKS